MLLVVTETSSIATSGPGSGSASTRAVTTASCPPAKKMTSPVTRAEYRLHDTTGDDLEAGMPTECGERASRVGGPQSPCRLTRNGWPSESAYSRSARP